ncbi:hypothetical protein Avbf_18533 [Armadillidium vulgare]|nr:hypothetical protein Avbf_18533 [Armadillidium vulgare]
MNYMVSIYYKSFCEVLSRAEKSPPFSYEELILEVKNRRIFGLSVGVLILSILFSEDTDALFDKTLPDNCSEGQNKTEKALLDSENPLRKRLLSMFDEFIEYGLFKLNLHCFILNFVLLIFRNKIYSCEIPFQ